jgi:hypothetical protein
MLSLLELLEDGEIKQALSAAQAFIAEEEHLKCLIECRKVIFIAFEQRYNVAMFRGSGNAASSLLMAFSSAPYYAKNPDYIAKNVSDPFGLIVLDHSELDRDLLKKKIDPEVFWNIWRGTPAVYRYETKAEWLVSRNLKIEDNGLNQEHSSYILEQTVEIALNLEGARKSAKYFGSGSFVVKLKSDGIKIYAKADKKSEVAFTVEDGLRELGVTESLPGFDGKIYWKVSHSTFDETQGGRFYYGYLLDEDVDWNAT